MKAFKQLPERSVVQKYLDYNPETGIFLWAQTLNNRVVKGRKAGTTTKAGYLKIKVYSGVFAAHRLAWLLYHGHDPGQTEIDHIDGNKLNNAITNLRIASTQQNTFNSRGYNKLGIKGVYPCGAGFRARIRYNRSSISLGVFATIEEAAKAYNTKAQELFGKFAWLNTL